jgi:hypothetical protein
VKYPSKPKWKPVFTADEIEAINNSESRQARKLLVKELRAKHLAAAGGAMAVNV